VPPDKQSVRRSGAKHLEYLARQQNFETVIYNQLMMSEKIGAQDFVQTLLGLRGYAFLLRDGENKEIKQEYDSTLLLLQTQLALWGGIENIDKWIQENDPKHSLVSACLSDGFNPFT
jgi:hypothetical protein